MARSVVFRHPREYLPVYVTAPEPAIGALTLGLPPEHSLSKKAGPPGKVSDARARDIILGAVTRFIRLNNAALIFFGANPGAVVDHVTVRTHSVALASQYFEGMGYTADPAEKLEYKDAGWWAQVLRKPGLPTAFVDQTYDEEANESKQIVKKWVDTFGDPLGTWASLVKTDPDYAWERYDEFGAAIAFHHIAVRVPDIQKAIAELKARGVDFGDNTVTSEEEEIDGKPTQLLLQIFTRPQAVTINSVPHHFSVLEIIERRPDPRTGEIYPYFRRRQADALMKSTGRA